MKKAANADIRNLFRKFGGDTGSYQEIQQDYVIDKAQKSWPIVAAMEKERISAPVLRAPAGSPVQRASATGTFAAYSATHLAPAAVSEQPIARPVARASATGTFAAYSAAQPAAVKEPQATLFAALNGAPKPAAPTGNPLFASLNPSAKAAGPFGAPPVAPQRSEKDAIASVFSRLLDPKHEVGSPDKSLRSLFGFLKK